MIKEALKDALLDLRKMVRAQKAKAYKEKDKGDLKNADAPKPTEKVPDEPSSRDPAKPGNNSEGRKMDDSFKKEIRDFLGKRNKGAATRETPISISSGPAPKAPAPKSGPKGKAK